MNGEFKNARRNEMPEYPVCNVCRRAINLETDNYSIPNKHEVDGKKDDYRYVHTECLRQVAA